MSVTRSKRGGPGLHHAQSSFDFLQSRQLESKLSINVTRGAVASRIIHPNKQQNMYTARNRVIPRQLPLLKDRQETPTKKGALNVGEAVGTCLQIIQREATSAEGKPGGRYRRINAAIDSKITRDAAIRTQSSLLDSSIGSKSNTYGSNHHASSKDFTFMRVLKQDNGTQVTDSSSLDDQDRKTQNRSMLPPDGSKDASRDKPVSTDGTATEIKQLTARGFQISQTRAPQVTVFADYSNENQNMDTN